MRLAIFFGSALLAATALPGAAFATNMCQAGKLTCATTMPVGGFCECKAHGETRDGTVVPRNAPHGHVNSSGAGCGAQPNAPGCNPHPQ